MFVENCGIYFGLGFSLFWLGNVELAKKKKVQYRKTIAIKKKKTLQQLAILNVIRNALKLEKKKFFF